MQYMNNNTYNDGTQREQRYEFEYEYYDHNPNVNLDKRQSDNRNNDISMPPQGIPIIAHNDIELVFINDGQENQQRSLLELRTQQEQCKLNTKRGLYGLICLVCTGGVAAAVVMASQRLHLTNNPTGDSNTLSNAMPDVKSSLGISSLTNFNDILPVQKECKIPYEFDRKTHIAQYKNPNLNIDLSTLSCTDLSKLTGVARDCGRKFPDIEASFQTGFDKHCEGYGNDKSRKRSLATQLSSGLESYDR